MKKSKNSTFSRYDKDQDGIPDILANFDERVINFFWKHSESIARISLFIIFFWFGILKVFSVSPADTLVSSLVSAVFGNAISPELFLIWFGGLEAITAFLILFARFERLTFALLFLHFVATAFPLLLLPEITWNGMFQPSLIGQYILKNLALLSIGILLFGRLKPITKTHSLWGEDKELTV